MALLTLKDIGKIYVSEGNVTVGIRGVNLSFDRGEFVAITGKSGSGKSTLLNIMSGMDTYEEGELYIEGTPTSHYLQPEWEQYRQTYISFIFQDYNIIESFTVLQNVELALMHMEDKKARREKAIELITRVGLKSHIRQKGSQLSGGQKQRTVIARALAKDSPIILADEPTGNLDAQTSKEIMALLKEVSTDKLVLVVTHNFDDVSAYATRHVRIFDGAVESDRLLATKAPASSPDVSAIPPSTPSRTIRDGLSLGGHIFFAKPKLSVFLCLLMVIAMLGIFAITSFCGEMGTLFEPSYMFAPIDGRVVVAHQNGTPLSEAEVAELAATYDAKDILHHDYLLDMGGSSYATYLYGTVNHPIELEYTYGETFGEDIIGHYPETVGEVFLYLPISYQTHFGKDELRVEQIKLMDSITYTISGVAYYYDNNLTPKCLFSNEGFSVATSMMYLMRGNFKDSKVICDDGNRLQNTSVTEITVSLDVPDGKIVVYSSALAAKKEANPSVTLSLHFFAHYTSYDYRFDTSPHTLIFEEMYEDDILLLEPSLLTEGGGVGLSIAMSDEVICALSEEVLSSTYRQASLFFDDKKEAEEKATAMRKAGYVAVPSHATYTPHPLDTVLNMIGAGGMAVVWVMSVLFLSFFLHLCSDRSLSAFKGDMAIMRSMGIPVRTIKVGMYVRMLYAMIPALVLMALSAILIFTSPIWNAIFTYLYGWQYALIVLGMLLITLRTTHKQIGKLFGESVKKALRGGATHD